MEPLLLSFLYPSTRNYKLLLRNLPLSAVICVYCHGRKLTLDGREKFVLVGTVNSSHIRHLQVRATTAKTGSCGLRVSFLSPYGHGVVTATTETEAGNYKSENV
jgi:hypothetical protein